MTADPPGLAARARAVIRSQTRNAYRLATGRRVQFPSLVAQSVGPDDVALARRLLGEPAGWFDPEPVREFESAVADWNGSARAFAFMGGRVALSACLAALELAPGDEVVLPAFTCVVVPNAVRFAGLVPVWADIELETFGLSIESLRERVGPRTRAVVVQHLFGLVSRDYEAVLEFARERGLRVVEDCAHALGASWRGIKVGNRGDLGFASTEHSKVISTGQGGIAFANEPTLAARLERFQAEAPLPPPAEVERQIANVALDYFRYKHPARWWRGDWEYLMRGDRILVSTTPEEEAGLRPRHYGRRMPGAIARLGLLQLSKVDAVNAARRRGAARWREGAADSGLAPPLELKDSVPVYLRYPAMVSPERKADLRWAERELGTRPGVWFLSKTHPAKETIAGCPSGDRAVAGCINLPTIADGEVVA